MEGNVAAIDGVRAVSTLSMVALHTVMLSTMHTTLGTREWTGYVHNSIYGLSTMAGFQVDALLVLSGLLLGLKLRRRLLASAGKTPSITSGISQYAISRAIRLWPVILFNIAFMYAIGDSLLQKDFKIIASAFLQCLTFTSNYADVLKYGSLTNTVMWSVCADYQIGLVLVALLYTLRRVCKKDTTFLACVQAALLLLLMASFAIRYALWDVSFGNEAVLGKYPHFGFFLTKASHGWIRDYLGFEIDLAGIVSPAVDLYSSAIHENSNLNAQAAIQATVMARLYFPTHARFGAMVIGMLFAFFLADGQPTKGAKKNLIWRGLSMVCSSALGLWALGSLVAVSYNMSTAEEIDALPDQVQMFITVAMRNVSSIAVGVILFLAINPPGSFLHSPPLALALGSRLWKPIAKLSYGINMVHIRIVLELTTKYVMPRGTLDHWYTLRLYSASVVASVTLAFLVSRLWEGLLHRLMGRLWQPTHLKVA
mmetsp:Transcript_27775/g.46479  ORF Transcript_27775/g.46479 Transcript_27775/m.46479 type:complete len:482 (+) Transcript_27775:183-1628(+)